MNKNKYCETDLNLEAFGIDRQTDANRLEITTKNSNDTKNEKQLRSFHISLLFLVWHHQFVLNNIRKLRNEKKLNNEAFCIIFLLRILNYIDDDEFSRWLASPKLFLLRGKKKTNFIHKTENVFFFLLFEFIWEWKRPVPRK